jgi:putative ABC transport system permease protein
MFKNYLKITWKVLKRKKIYTFVTLAGIIIPVTFIVLITSFLVQLNSYDSPKSDFKDVIFLDRVTWKGIKEDGKVNQRTTNPPTISFINKYVKTMKTPESISVISANVFGGKDIIYQNDKPNEVNIKYTDAEFWGITDFNFISGRPFNSAEYNQAAQVVVIDKKTSNTFFGTTEAVGNTIEIKNKNFKVLGVVENVNITMFRITANIYFPYSCNDNFLSTSSYQNFSTALILRKEKTDFKNIENEYEQKLKTVTFENMGNLNHVEGELTHDSYMNRLKELASKFFQFYGDVKKPIQIAVAILLFFFIILPAINLININVNRVYERLSEIGIRKTFGATKSMLIQQFLFENIILILAGGIISIILSTIIISGINKADIIPGIQLKIHFMAILISLLAIFILGLLSGLMPSINMARTKIIQSLTNSESK